MLPRDIQAYKKGSCQVVLYADTYFLDEIADQNNTQNINSLQPPSSLKDHIVPNVKTTENRGSENRPSNDSASMTKHVSSVSHSASSPSSFLETEPLKEVNSTDTPTAINSGTIKITSVNLMDDEDFKRRMHIAEVVEKYIKQVYPHMLNPPEAAKLDNRHPWEVKNDRYKEFIEFFKQYMHDRKRVSYN